MGHVHMMNASDGPGPMDSHAVASGAEASLGEDDEAMGREWFMGGGAGAEGWW